MSSILLLIAPCLLGTTKAFSYFEICNDTDERISTAFASPSRGDWRSKGWWILDGGECAIVLSGRLGNRYYYVHGQGDDGGQWTGDHSFCTTQRAFEILGGRNCRARGYDRHSFFQVDTTDADNFTLTLTSSSRGDRGDPFEVDLAPALNNDHSISNEVRGLCNSVCQGNERRSWIHSAVLRFDPNATYSRGTIHLRLRSRHVPMRGVVFYDHTENVRIRFRIHNVSCRAEVLNVSASGFIAQAAITIVDQFSRLASGGGLARALGQHRMCPS